MKLTTFPSLCGAGIVHELSYRSYPQGHITRRAGETDEIFNLRVRLNNNAEDFLGRATPNLEKALKKAWLEQKAMVFLSLADYQLKGRRGARLLNQIINLGFKPITKWTFNPNSENYIRVYMVFRPDMRFKD